MRLSKHGKYRTYSFEIVETLTELKKVVLHRCHAWFVEKPEGSRYL